MIQKNTKQQIDTEHQIEMSKNIIDEIKQYLDNK